MYSSHLLTSFASVMSIPFLSFIVPIFGLNVPLVFLIFLNRSLVFPKILFSLFLCNVHLIRLSYISLLFLATLHSDGYIFFFFPLLLLLFFSSAIFKASLDNYFAFFSFIFLGDGLDHGLLYNITNVTNLNSPSGTLSIRSKPLNLFFTSTVTKD